MESMSGRCLSIKTEACKAQSCQATSVLNVLCKSSAALGFTQTGVFLIVKETSSTRCSTLCVQKPSLFKSFGRSHVGYRACGRDGACKRAQASRAAAEELLGPDGRARRCASDSLMCMLVYIFSGHCSQTAADFVRGRGWRPGLSDLAEQEEIVADVEWAYIGMPTVTLVDLELAPLTLVSTVRCSVCS